MTVVKKQVLPALHDSGKVKDPDLQEIGEKNYTSTILKYSNLAIRFPQLKTDAKTIVAAINELYGRSNVIPNPPIGDGTLETESDETIECENGDPLESEQGGGGGSVVGPLNYIQIDGDIYSIPGGGGGGSSIKTACLTLRASDWDGSYQAVSLSGVTSSTHVVYSPNYRTVEDYQWASISLYSIGDGYITFSKNYEASSNIFVDIVYWG